MNCTPFFEEVLVTAAQKDMIKCVGEEGKFAIRETCTLWFQQRFQISVRITDKSI